MSHDLVTSDDQGPFRGDPRIQLAERTGGRVPWIGEGLLSSLRDAPVERLEVVQSHVDFGPCDETGRRISIGLKLERKRSERPEVDGHILADRPVPPGGATGKDAVLVDQLDRQAVVFRFHGVVNRGCVHLLAQLPSQFSTNAFVEGQHVFHACDRIETQHGSDVLCFFELR